MGNIFLTSVRDCISRFRASHLQRLLAFLSASGRTGIPKVYILSTVLGPVSMLGGISVRGPLWRLWTRALS